MKVSKAVITAASQEQSALSLQALVDRNGQPTTVLGIIAQEAASAGINDICIVCRPEDQDLYQQSVGSVAAAVHFVTQGEPLGYGHAVYCSRDFVAGEPFLHLVGDHVYVSTADLSCAQQVVKVAESHACSVSGVQPTHERLLSRFGTVGGHRMAAEGNVYHVDRILEKPTPTAAEQSMMVPGLRTGHYLCFFGIHVLTPGIMPILEQDVADAGASGRVGLTPALAKLATREQYLALETQGRRYAVDARYGLLQAQLALALSGRDRDEVLTGLCDLLAQNSIVRD